MEASSAVDQLAPHLEMGLDKSQGVLAAFEHDGPFVRDSINQ